MLDPLPDVLDQGRIAQQLHMELEDLGGLGPQLRGGPVPVALQVRQGRVHRFSQPFELGPHFLLGDGAIGHVLDRVVENECSPHDHAGRHRDALDNFHQVKKRRPGGSALSPEPGQVYPKRSGNT